MTAAPSASVSARPVAVPGSSRLAEQAAEPGVADSLLAELLTRGFGRRRRSACGRRIPKSASEDRDPGGQREEEKDQERHRSMGLPLVVNG